MRRAHLASLAICCLTTLLTAARGAEFVVPPLPTSAALREAQSFPADEPVLATHYFYWYKWPDEHFFDDRRTNDDGQRQHFPDHRDVSYESAAWHRRQMEDLSAAGIDVALCIYWGAPNQYDKPEIRFSVHGLPPLVAALDELSKKGRTPRIGLFYDTSTLLAENAFQEPRATNVDLRTDQGKDIFYRTIRDFFCQIPPRHWACIDGRPLVQLYEAGSAAGHDPGLMDYVNTRFAADFAGRRPYLIAGPAWPFEADARLGWGAAVGGPIISGAAAQVGPGYDDSPVPGRTTPTRDRLGGAFYEASWLLALQARPRLVIIETWNELHEGTAICETVEDGRFYIDLTRQYVDRLKRGETPREADWSRLVMSLLNACGSNRAGREHASRLTLTLTAEQGGLKAEGLRLCDVADGLYELGEAAGTPCLRTRPGAGGERYLYFDVADPYYYDQRSTLTLRITYFDDGTTPIVVEYDSTDDTGALADRYKPLASRIARSGSQKWQSATLTLPGARCMNRQNGGADFRVLALGSDLTLGRIEVTKLPANYAE